MRPVQVSVPDLVEFLHTVALEIERGGSAEGSISWSWPGLGIWTGVSPAVELEAQQAGRMFVNAAVRNGNDMGQGGMWLLVASEPEPAEPKPDARQEATDLRAQTIRSRMVNDIARQNPMLAREAVEDLADHGMFHVEHLLAEIEGLRTDNSTREADHNAYE